MKVSFDRALFLKELLKARKWLKDTKELNKLKTWCYREFYHLYPKELNIAFGEV